jgi:hypothetical protein
VDRYLCGPGHVSAAAAETQIEFLSESFWGEVSPPARRQRYERRPTMNQTAMQAILWIVAGFFLTLLIIRRGKRKARG